MGNRQKILFSILTCLLYALASFNFQVKAQFPLQGITCTGCTPSASTGYATAALAVAGAGAGTTPFTANTILPNQTIKLCANVTSDPNGTLGIIQVIETNQVTGNTTCTPGTAASRKGSLYLNNGSGGCTGPEIQAIRKGSNSSTFNNEYVGLAPNTNYVFVIELTVNSTCNYFSSSSVRYYGAVTPQFTFNCAVSSSTGTFIQGTPSTGTLTVGITGTTAGATTFNVSGTGFTGTLSTTLTTGQTSVTIPISYDGTAPAGSQTLTVTSATGGGTCSKAVTVSNPPLTASTPTAKTAITNQAKTGTASTELSPVGGNGTYTYSVDNTGSCTPVVGALPLPVTSNLTVTNASTGAYTYTAPAVAGTYYYCIKVCDTSTPTPVCVTKTYTLTVSLPPCVAGSIAPIITATTVANICPATTFNLAALANTGIKPAGTSLIWSTHKVPTSAGDTLTNLTTVSTAGKYYALYYDKTNSCYSPADSVTATISTCPTPFNCPTKGFLFQSIPTDILEIDLATGIATPFITAIYPYRSTAAYNPKDNFLWAYTSNLEFAKIGSNGAFTTYTIPGVSEVNINNAAIDDNGIMYLYANTTVIYRVDLNPSSPTYLTALSNLTTTSTLSADWVAIPGDNFLYTVGNDFILYKINKTTGVRTTVGTVSGDGISSQAAVFGAQFSDNLNNLYLQDNLTGRVFKITNVPAGNLVAKLVSTTITSGNNDGARCPSAALVVCEAGATAPAITATTVTNTCPTTTFSLASLANTGIKPSGTSLIWSTHKVPTSAGDTLTNLTTVSTAGKYYALYYDKVSNCYSPADSVTATLSVCAVNPAAQTALPSTPKSGTASTDLTPTGGNGTYVYSVDNTGSCTPVVGALPLPITSNLTVTNASTGAYTYTAPAVVGTYYFCIKVCDTSTPTPNCITKTYTLTVSAIPCVAGILAPIITATTVTNTCPTTTFSLAALANTGIKPEGTTLVWSTHKVPTSAGDTLTNLTTLSTAGKYYAMYYDKVGGCYSPADSVTASLTICTVNPPSQTASVNQAKTGTASTDLTPTGGNGTYVYSVDNTGSCTPVVGALPLPLTSSLTVTNTSTGAYSYTAPAVAGTYYYCIKVCDTTTPTPNCSTKTYTLTVSPPVCAVGTSIPGLK